MLQKGIQLGNTKVFGDWLTCANYEKNYMSGLPKITSNTSVEYEGRSFVNCVEATIFNLCNIATYNGSNLGDAPADVQMNSSLQNFYSTQKANMPSEVSNYSVHQAFVDVVENMPGIAYNRLKISGQQSGLSLPSEYEGFMPVDQH